MMNEDFIAGTMDYLQDKLGKHGFLTLKIDQPNSNPSCLLVLFKYKNPYKAEYLHISVVIPISILMDSEHDFWEELILYPYTISYLSQRYLTT